MDQYTLGNPIKSNDYLISDVIINNEQRTSTISSLSNINKLCEPEGKKVTSISNTTSKSSLSLKESNELLGSVTTFTPTCGPDSGHTVRTSARVIQKMRMDSIRPPTPPIPEKKDQIKEEKPGPKTPNQIKSTRNAWTHTDTIFFFEALNEYGKDFESIAHYVNTKTKRKNSSNVTFKTRDQIRIFYYQSLQKVSKYLKFSDDVKKLAQELYALINYGEMRKKLIFVNEKSLMKLRDLVYKGWVTIRSKGRNIKIKTPSCKALRQLNQLEEWQEEIKLPPRIEVLMKPSNVETWGKVHSIAQNPRVKMTLPIQRRVSSILKTLQLKWKFQDLRLCDKSMTLQPNTVTSISIVENLPIIRILPPPNAVIHRPMVNIMEFLSSHRICLNSYEERIGVKVKGETLCSERINSLKEMMKTNSKRQRHDSNSDKKSPEFKKSKLDFDIKPLEPCEKLEIYLNTSHMFNPSSSDCNDIVKSSGDEGDLCNDDDSKNDKYLSDNEEKCESYLLNSQKLGENNGDSENDNEIRNEEKLCSPKDYKFEDSLVISKKKIKKSKKNVRNSSNYIKPLISDETMKLVREGWTLSNIGDITIGDLYVMFGNDLKLNLEYSITRSNLSADRSAALSRDVSANISICGPSINGDIQIETITIKTQNDKIDNGRVENSLGTKLRQLILIASLMEQKKKKTSGCICGHNCERNVRLKKADDFTGSYISNKSHISNQNDSYVFRPPTLPARTNLPGIVTEPYKHHVSNVVQINQQQPKSLKMKNRQPFTSKQVVVKRILPLHPNNESPALSDNKISSVASSTQQSQQTQNNNFEIKIDTGPSNQSQLNPVTGVILNNIESTNSTESNSVNKSMTDSGDLIDNHLDMPDLENNQNCFIKTVNDNIKCLLDTRDMLPNNTNHDEKRQFEQSYSNLALSTNSKEISLSHLNEDTSINTEWLTPDINDFSFSSFLGHLDNLAENSRKEKNQEENLDSNLSIISESSVDYMTKFAQITAELKERECDGIKNEIIN